MFDLSTGFGPSQCHLVSSLSLRSFLSIHGGDKTVNGGSLEYGWKFAFGPNGDAHRSCFSETWLQSLPADFLGYNPGYGILTRSLGSPQGYWRSRSTSRRRQPTVDYEPTTSTDHAFPDTGPYFLGQKSSCATGAYGAGRPGRVHERLQLPEQLLEPDHRYTGSLGQVVTRSWL